ncbi:MAG: CDP-alcohol phosphatidyltransferase family protein [Alphaproteobacteria bacterium]|nr:CDP-alcohol phosphatidyltransferase family protein [Alphaproteobacteria bacterium]
MIDGTNRNWSARFWHALAMPLVKSGLSPNQVTWIGLFLVLGNCAFYLVHRESLWLGLGLMCSFAFDALDGAVARLTGKTSKYGGYLDAVIDRYQELAAYLAIAYVTDWWALAFLALSGSLLVSYNKARTALEIPIENHNWPDLMERFERIFVLCAALILDRFFTLPDFLGNRVLFLGLVIIAGLSHVTAVQRFLRARAMLLKAPEK